MAEQTQQSRLKPQGVDREIPFEESAVEAVFSHYPIATGLNLMRLRALIFETAAALKQVGTLVETLKWRQPAYLPKKPRIGTTIRIDAHGGEGGYAMYFHCQTTLVATFRELYPELFSFEGNRAILFRNSQAIPRNALSHCIGMALTYHLPAR